MNTRVSLERQAPLPMVQPQKAVMLSGGDRPFAAFENALKGTATKPMEGVIPGGMPQGGLSSDVVDTAAQLQKEFPRREAHLTSAPPLGQTMLAIRNSWSGLGKWWHHLPLKDYEASSLDTVSKMVGSGLIATLATFGLRRGTPGFPELLGLGSWFGSMALTPKIINGMVYLKTGLNPGQLYNTAYGERKELLTDPSYLPNYLWPQKTLDRVASRFDIPANAPDRERRIDEKIRQISVQTRTWWMLVAGPATVALTGFFCDWLQHPLLQLRNSFRQEGSRTDAMRQLDKLHRSLIGEKNVLADADLLFEAVSVDRQAEIAQYSNQYMERLLGAVPNSELSGWWVDFNGGIIQKTGLAGNKDLSEAMLAKGGENASLQARFQKMVEHFAAIPANDSRVTAGLEYLKAQDTILKEMEERATGFLKTYRVILQDCKVALANRPELIRKLAEDYGHQVKKLDPSQQAAYVLQQVFQPMEDALVDQSRQVEQRLQNAKSTVGHYRTLLTTVKNTALTSPARTQAVRVVMENTNLSSIQTLMNHGSREEARRLAGSPEVFDKLTKALKAEQHNVAFELLGASPKAHLMEALQNHRLRRLWQGRMLGWVGGTLAGLTVLYTGFFVGHDFSKKPGGVA